MCVYAFLFLCARRIHALPRSTISGRKGRNAPLGPDDDGPYFDPFISVLVFCGVIGLMTVALGVVICVMRYVCACCGGPEPDPNGYTEAAILCPRIALPIVSTLAVVVGLIAIYGQVLFAGALDGIPEDIAARGIAEFESVNTMTNLLRSIDQQQVPYDCDPNCNRTVTFADVMSEYEASAVALRDEAESAPDTFSSGNGGRLAILALYLVSLIITGLLGCGAAGLKNSKMASGAASCSFFVMLFAWFNIGVAFVIAMGASDWCFFNDAPIIEAGPRAMVANETTVKVANEATDLADIFQPTGKHIFL